jgi:NADH-quinone oxidoreductase subunit A
MLDFLSIVAQAQPRSAWAPVALLIVVAIVFSVGTVVASALIGPRRSGAAKGMSYESGVAPVGDTRRRFNVRFYVVAMIFLVFDVEIIFLYPWATIFPQAPTTLLLVEVLIFVGILLVAYAYAWGKGVFRWD